MVTCRSLATRRTSAANAAGIVTLCRTDLAADALFLVAIVSEYQECTRVVQMVPEMIEPAVTASATPLSRRAAREIVGVRSARTDKRALPFDGLSWPAPKFSIRP